MDADHKAVSAEVRPVNDSCRCARGKEDAAVNNELPSLPVALRNTQITEEDANRLFQKAEEMVEKGTPPATAPKRVREGKRERVRA